MFRSRVGVVSLLFTAGLTAVDAQQYVISTYAGGAPVPPTSALSIATDASGNVYFVDGYGNNSTPAASNSVFKIDAAGLITRVAGNFRSGFTGDGAKATTASLTLPQAVAADSAGNVFIVDAGNQRVRRVSPDGIITTVAGGGSAVLGDGGPATEGQLNYPNSIVIDRQGNLFIGELGRVRKVSADGTISTVAGGGSDRPGDGGPATGARLLGGVRAAIDGAGNIFVLEQNYNDDIDSYDYVIRKVSQDGTISTLTPIALCCNGGIAADAAGNVYVAAGPVVLKISPDGAQTVVAGNGRYGAPSGDGQPAIQAQLNGPSSVAVDAAGDLFLADSSGRVVRKVTPDGIIRPVGSIPNSAPILTGDGGAATSAQLQLAFPGLSSQGGLAADGEGNLYIAETGAHRVRKVSPSGTITTVAGIGAQRCSGPSTCLPLGDGGPATSAALSYPTSVAVDSAGNLYIADSSNLRVRKVGPDGIITTVAGNGNTPPFPRVLNNGGLATGTAIIPFQVAVDGAGNLFISEGNYATVRKVSPEGFMTTVLPSGTALPRFGFITAVTADRIGNLFIAGSACDDSDNCSQRIIKFSAGGAVTVIAGLNPINFLPGSDVGDGGPAGSARIGLISNLAVDSAGNIFIADLIGQRVRKIDINGIITTVGGNGMPGYSGDGGAGANATVSYPVGLAIDGAGNVYVSDFSQAVRLLRPEIQ